MRARVRGISRIPIGDSPIDGICTLPCHCVKWRAEPVAGRNALLVAKDNSPNFPDKIMYFCDPPGIEPLATWRRWGRWNSSNGCRHLPKVTRPYMYIKCNPRVHMYIKCMVNPTDFLSLSSVAYIRDSEDEKYMNLTFGWTGWSDLSIIRPRLPRKLGEFVVIYCLWFHGIIFIYWKCDEVTSKYQ